MTYKIKKFVFIGRNWHIHIMNVSANISAMNAASFSFGVSAHNLANMSTEGFKASEVTNIETPSGGPRPVVHKTEHGTDVTKEIIRQKQLTYDFKANAKVIQAHDQMVGTIIDILA